MVGILKGNVKREAKRKNLDYDIFQDIEKKRLVKPLKKGEKLVRDRIRQRRTVSPYVKAVLEIIIIIIIIMVL